MPNACESLLRLQEIYTENTNEMKNKINILEKYIPKNIFARKSDLKKETEENVCLFILSYLRDVMFT